MPGSLNSQLRSRLVSEVFVRHNKAHFKSTKHSPHPLRACPTLTRSRESAHEDVLTYIVRYNIHTAVLRRLAGMIVFKKQLKSHSDRPPRRARAAGCMNECAMMRVARAPASAAAAARYDPGLVVALGLAQYGRTLLSHARISQNADITSGVYKPNWARGIRTRSQNGRAVLLHARMGPQRQQ